MFVLKIVTNKYILLTVSILDKYIIGYSIHVNNLYIFAGWDWTDMLFKIFLL